MRARRAKRVKGVKEFPDFKRPCYLVYYDGETVADAAFAKGEEAFKHADVELRAGAYRSVSIVREAKDGHRETLYTGNTSPFLLPVETAKLEPHPRSRPSALAEAV